MSLVPTAVPTFGGEVLTATAATAGPDEVYAGGILLVRNAGAAAITVDIAVPGDTYWGQPQPDITTPSIPAGEMAAIKITDNRLQDDDGTIKVTASDPTDVTFFSVRH